MNWPALPASPALAGDEVHVIGWSPDGGAARLSAWRASMSADEVERAARFRFDRHRVAWEAARGGLRELLGRYCGRAGSELRFTLSADGKPALVGGGGLRFNLSHTEGLVALAISRGGALGVDVEALRPVPERAAIARTHFSVGENRRFASEEAAGRGEGYFLRLWTRKEAVIKAVGIGLGYPLPRVDVSLLAGAQRPRFEPGAPGADGAWALSDLDVGAEHMGAVACRFLPAGISFFWMR